MKVAIASYAGEPRYFDFLIPDRGLAQLAAVLEQAGVTCRIFDLNRIDITFGSFLKELRRFSPDIIGFKFFDTGFAAVCTLAETIRRQFPGVPIIAGGPHVSLFREHIFHATDVFDLAVYGEGERAILQVIDCVDKCKPFDDVRAAIFRSASDEIITTPQNLIADLDELPIPRWDALSLDSYLPIAMLNTYRGCRRACAFCAHNRTWGYEANPNLKAGYKPISNRQHTLPRIYTEIKSTISEYGIRAFGFTDSTPIAHLWRQIAQLFIEVAEDVAWTSFAYIGDFGEADFDLFAQSGCAALWYGIESGNPDVRRIIGKRDFTNEQVIQEFEWAKARGIVPIPGFIMGFPRESIESFKMSRDLAERLDVPVKVFSPFILDPGTPIAMNPSAYGVQCEPDWECQIVKRDRLNEFEIPYYTVDGKSNVTLWNEFQATGVYPGFDMDRNLAESEYAYLLARSHGVDPHALVRDLDFAMKTRDMPLLRKTIDPLWSY